jgi:hypothetical protein
VSKDETEDERLYGFRWGQFVVQRVADIDGRKVIDVKTDSNTVSVYASRTGRSLRVFKNGRELK